MKPKSRPRQKRKKNRVFFRLTVTKKDLIKKGSRFNKYKYSRYNSVVFVEPFLRGRTDVYVGTTLWIARLGFKRI